MSTTQYLSDIEKLHKKENDQAFLKGTRGGAGEVKGKLEDDDDLDDTKEGGDNNYAINF